MDDAKLLRDARRGDVQAFNTLVLAYQESLFNLACCLLDDDRQAEQAVEQVVRDAFRDLRNSRVISFRCWLLARLVRECQKASGQGARSADRTSAGTQEAVWACLQGLGLEARALVALVDLEGLNYREAASVLDRPVEFIQANLALARRELCRSLPIG